MLRSFWHVIDLVAYLQNLMSEVYRNLTIHSGFVMQDLKNKSDTRTGCQHEVCNFVIKITFASEIFKI